jgi:predicted DCC family thiol-disulfide oxidoreductase YuxK
MTMSGMSSRNGVTLRAANAVWHQPVDAVLGAQQPVRVAALHHERRGRDARLRACGDVLDLGSEALALGPPQVHAQEHVRPVLGVGAALARLDLAQDIALVVLAGEQASQLQLAEVGVEGCERQLDLLDHRVVTLLARQLGQRLDVVDAVAEGVVELEVVGGRRQLPGDLAGTVGVVPQIGARRFGLELGSPGPELVDLQVLRRLGVALAQGTDLVADVSHDASILPHGSRRRGTRCPFGHTGTVTTEVEPPVLLFDGDCAFCSSAARWLQRRVATPTRLVAWQLTDIEALGATEAEVDEAVVMVGVDLLRTHGPEAIASLLRTSTSGAWRGVGAVLSLRPVLAVAWPVYRLIGRNRHRMPGGTPQCSLPAAERDHEQR